MAIKRKLLDRVENLLDRLITEAQEQVPAVVDADGIEVKPARFAATFGERLKLAEVATNFELRREKIVKDDVPADIEGMMQEFQHNAGRAVESRRGRKANKPPETDGIANNGHVLPGYPNGTTPAAP